MAVRIDSLRLAWHCGAAGAWGRGRGRTARGYKKAEGFACSSKVLVNFPFTNKRVKVVRFSKETTQQTHGLNQLYVTWCIFKNIYSLVFSSGLRKQMNIKDLKVIHLLYSFISASFYSSCKIKGRTRYMNEEFLDYPTSEKCD